MGGPPFQNQRKFTTMPSAIITKTFKPSLFRDQVIARRFRIISRNEGRKIRTLLLSTVKHWEGARPDFKVRQQVAPTRSGDIIVTVTATGSVEAVEKFLWLDKGTDVRYAHMSRDFKRKTRAGVLKTNAGKTGTPYFKRRARRNKKGQFNKGGGSLIPAAKNPGIEARDWTGIVARRRQPEFRRQLRRELALMVRNKKRQP